MVSLYPNPGRLDPAPPSRSAAAACALYNYAQDERSRREPSPRTGRARQQPGAGAESPVTATPQSGRAGKGLLGSGSCYPDPKRRILRLPRPLRRVTSAQAGTHGGWALGAAFLSLLPSTTPALRQRSPHSRSKPAPPPGPPAQAAHLPLGPQGPGWDARARGGRKGSAPGRRSDRGTPAGPPAPPPALPLRRPAASPAAAPRPAPRAPVTPSPAPLLPWPRFLPFPPGLPGTFPPRCGRHSGKRDAPFSKSVLPAPARPGPATPPLLGLLAERGGESGPARASSAGLKPPARRSPGAEPARPSVQRREGRSGGRAPAAASRLRPPVATGRAAAALPPALPLPLLPGPAAGIYLPWRRRAGPWGLWQPEEAADPVPLLPSPSEAGGTEPGPALGGVT